MKFIRTSSSSKVTEPVDVTTSAEFPSFFSSKTKNMEPTESKTTQPKSSRLFSRKNRDEPDFDMMKTVGGDEDGRNEKSSRNMFRRKSKGERSSKGTANNESIKTGVVPAIFAFPTTGSVTDKEVREEPSTRSLFRTRSKEQVDAAETNEKAKDVPEAPAASDSVVSTKSTTKLFTKGERTQIKAVIHSFSSEADSIKVEKDDVAPTVAAPNHVLIKVQVRILERCLPLHGFLLRRLCLTRSP
jgi:hypothetical protein